MTRSLSCAGVVFSLLISLLVVDVSPAQAQSTWARCENNTNWTDRIAACQAVIRSGGSAARLSVAHLTIAQNLELSYEQHLRGDTSGIDKLMGPMPTGVCDQLIIIYSPDPFAAQQRCDEFNAKNGINQPKIGEPTTTDINRVVEEYSTALRHDPAHIGARKRRGVLYSKQNRFKESIADLNVVLRSNTNDNQAHYLRGNAYYASGDYAAAIPDFDAALSGNEFTAAQKLQIRHQRAYAHLATNNYDAAILDFSAFIKETAAQSDTYAKRARAYSGLGKFKEAEADFGHALSLTPPAKEMFSIHWSRGSVRLQLNNLTGAIDDFSNALKIEENAELFYLRGRAQFEISKYSETKADATKALALGLPDAGGRAQALELRAFALMRLQEFAAAIEDFSSVIAIRPATHLYFNRANIFRAMGNTTAALPDYQKVIADEKAPASMRTQAFLGLAFIAHAARDEKNAMANYDAFFTSLIGADDQTRALGAQIVQSLIQKGYYIGVGQRYDADFRNALAACITAPDCSP